MISAVLHEILAARKSLKGASCGSLQFLSDFPVLSRPAAAAGGVDWSPCIQQRHRIEWDSSRVDINFGIHLDKCRQDGGRGGRAREGEGQGEGQGEVRDVIGDEEAGG